MLNKWDGKITWLPLLGIVVTESCFRILQRTSISTNIKERLDFSCALFGEDGGLVSNAPHIPVHLGAMQVFNILFQGKLSGLCHLF